MLTLWRCAETKIGVLAPGTDGKLGIGKVLESLLGSSVFLASAEFLSAFFCLSLFSASSLSLARKGFSALTRFLKGLIALDPCVGAMVAENVDEPLSVTEEGLTAEDGLPENLLKELLNLLCPLFSRLALARNLELENWGVFRAELAGVAMSVGLMLILVLVATVVLTLLLVGLKNRPGLRRIGLMIGVNVFPGLDDDPLPLGLDGRTILLGA